jgi:hypothetical protein
MMSGQREVGLKKLLCLSSCCRDPPPAMPPAVVEGTHPGAGYCAANYSYKRPGWINGLLNDHRLHGVILGRSDIHRIPTIAVVYITTCHVAWRYVWRCIGIGNSSIKTFWRLFDDGWKGVR